MKIRTLLTAFICALWGASPLLAEPPSDAEATRLLQGDWTRPPKGALLSAFFTFKPDGTFSSHSTFLAGGGKITIETDGKWRVEKGILIEEVTRSSHPNLAPAGLATRDTLLSVTEKEYRYRTEQGAENAYQRAEPK